MENSKKALIAFLGFIFLVALGYYYANGHYSIAKKAREFNVSLIEDCERYMKVKNYAGILCTLKNGELAYIYDTTNLTFKRGDYLCLHINLAKLDIPYNTYYSCFYSNFPLYETSYPKRYGQSKPGIYYPSFICSGKLKKGDYHHWSLSGFVLNKQGKYTLAEIYVFDGNLPENFDFKNNLDKGVKILSIEGEVA